MDGFAVAETKLDSSFPESEFPLEGMRKPIRLHVYAKKRWLISFSPFKFLQNFDLPGNIQAILFEVILNQRKLSVDSVYPPSEQRLDYFLS